MTDEERQVEQVAAVLNAPRPRSHAAQVARIQRALVAAFGDEITIVHGPVRGMEEEA